MSPTSTIALTTSRTEGDRHDRIPDSRLSARSVARLAGAAYLLMFALAILAKFLVLDGLVVEGDAAATTTNIADAPLTMAGGIIAFVGILLLDLFLSWALYVVFRAAGRVVASAMACFRGTYSIVLGIALLFLAQALLAATSGAAAPMARAEQTMGAVDAFQATWLLGLVLFGVHLVLLGLLVVRSGFAPRVLGFVLAVAGVAYIADTAAHLLLSDYEAVASILLAVVALPSMIGEGWLGFWLLLTRRIPR